MKNLYDNYRIVVTTEKSGKQWFQVEQRVFWFFWVGRMRAKPNQRAAEAIVEYFVEKDMEEIESKVIDKKIVWHPNKKD